jgi:enoyl-CoA hydratase
VKLAVARHGRIVSMVLDGPDEDNRLTPEVLRSLETHLAALQEDGEAQVVLITGAGERFFSAGILNPAIRASYTKEQVLAIVRLANRVYDALEALPQITIAALNGVTRAGAAELALACDIRLAASHATFALPEARWGGFPGAGAPVRLPAIVGRARALELICTGREVGAEEMARIGLVLEVHPGPGLTAAARALAERIAASGPLATRGAKRILTAREHSGPAAARALSDALRQALEWSRDVDEGIAAHREGRTPDFTGR